MNRRNVLLGIGGTVIAGGAALGSGAFSQVEASRTVNVSTQGDADALLAFNVDTDYNGLSDGGDTEEETFSLDLEKINQDAITRFDGGLTVTNNGNEDVELEADTPDAITFEETDGDEDLGGEVLLESEDDDGVDFDVVIDLETEEEEPDGETITFTATSTE